MYCERPVKYVYTSDEFVYVSKTKCDQKQLYILDNSYC